MASPTSSTSNTFQTPPPPPPPPPLSPLFTSIPELEVEEEAAAAAAEDTFPYKHQPTPLHLQPKKAAGATPSSGGSSFSVLCNKCRPSSRDKNNSVVPVDTTSSLKSPTSKLMIHSLLSSLTRASSRTPKPTPTPTATEAASPDDAAYWKTATVELSRKLISATRKRDEALLEASRLKHSISDLESKLAKLESYCLRLSTSLEDSQMMTSSTIRFPTDSFLSAVSSARAAVRALARSGRGGGPLAHVEASLNRVFYDDFERCCSEGGPSLDPAGRCEASRAAYEAVRGVTWEEVLSRGTKHYSEGLSRFCDRKMGEVVAALGWPRAWPEVLLQAFFAAAKGVWMVMLLARCAHPAVPVMRVEGGAAFDAAYMEDVAVGEKVRRLTPVSVRMMVSPGFYVCSASGGEVGVVKCKVLCAYSNSVKTQN